jgi:DNA-binding FadR family transcriptional regulator
MKNMKIRTHHVVLDKLGEAIVKGRLKPLENLLPDTELCKEYNIGRNTLREVFKVLSSKGLLEASPRRGTWVSDPEHWDILDPDVLQWSVGTALHAKILLDVSEARTLIEPAAARLAARYAKIADVATIEAAYERMEQALPGTAEAGQADVDFHLALFKASHNHLWIKFGHVLSFALGQLFKTNAMQDKYLEELPLHREALQAIRLKDEAAAERALQRLTRHSVATCEAIVKEHFLIAAL